MSAVWFWGCETPNRLFIQPSFWLLGLLHAFSICSGSLCLSLKSSGYSVKISLFTKTLMLSPSTKTLMLSPSPQERLVVC